jgi:HSP20 family protein
MSDKKQTQLAAPRAVSDPFALLRQVTSELDRVFEQPFKTAFRWPAAADLAAWAPQVDVFQRDGQLVTKVDLPGLKKEDIKVEIADGYLVVSGERKDEAEDKQENFYRCERSYGSFYRAVPLPDGVKADEVKATFEDGVLQVRVPLAVAAKPQPQTVPIETPAPTPAKTAA